MEAHLPQLEVVGACPPLEAHSQLEGACMSLAVAVEALQ